MNPVRYLIWRWNATSHTENNSSLSCLEVKIQQAAKFKSLAVTLYTIIIMIHLHSKAWQHLFLVKETARRPSFRQQCQPHSIFGSLGRGEDACIGSYVSLAIARAETVHAETGVLLGQNPCVGTHGSFRNNIGSQISWPAFGFQQIFLKIFKKLLHNLIYSIFIEIFNIIQQSFCPFIVYVLSRIAGKNLG